MHNVLPAADRHQAEYRKMVKKAVLSQGEPRDAAVNRILQ